MRPRCGGIFNEPFGLAAFEQQLAKIFFKIGAQLVKIYEKLQDVPFIRTRCIHITHTHMNSAGHTVV